MPSSEPIFSAVKRREIRVFVSSTFRDMQEEREELVKRVFPILRHLCDSRGVTWGEVDLRWGVPDEAKAEGKVLPLCLAEIEHCRPYFIGLLGERYGWVPEELPLDLLDSQPWLKHHRGKSVTALEIMHGVLENPEMAEHAIFYFRDPATATGHEGFIEESPALREKLIQLKSDIRASGFLVREPFLTPKQLGAWVLDDIAAVIEKLYPEQEIPSQFDRAVLDHEAYSESRRKVYIGRPEYMARLDEQASSDGPPLAVVGESGGGKSALLANWSHAWSEAHPEIPMLVHFIGASADSADWMAMLRRLLGEFERKMGVKVEIPDKPDQLRSTFANALYMAAARGKLVLVLDALNQIEDRDGAPDLVWLPPVIPANVRLILSTLPGRPWEELKKRSWQVLQVAPLTASERERLIVDYLKRFAKALDEPRRRRISQVPQTGNGLYLSTLLNELRLFGRHEDLDRRIDWYLEAADPFELYEKVIQRWEQDYEEVGTTSEDLVGRSLTRIWAARRGLSETELLGSLGGAVDAPLPRAVWTPLFLAAGDALMNRNGLLTFAHEYLREAVRSAYLSTETKLQQVHRTMAEYFDRQEQSVRRLDELPWQWQEACQWNRLAYLLAEPDDLESLWKKDEFEVRAYWVGIELHSTKRMEEAYSYIIKNPVLNIGHANRVSTLLDVMNRPECAVTIHALLAAYYRRESDHPKLAQSLGRQASYLAHLGDLRAAVELHSEEELICREIGNREQLEASLCNQAGVLARLDLRRALEVHERHVALCRELRDSNALQLALGNKANTLFLIGNLDAALICHREEEEICRRVRNLKSLPYALCNQGNIHSKRGEIDEANAQYRDAEHIARMTGDRQALSHALLSQLEFLRNHDNKAGAMSVLLEIEHIGREVGFWRNVAIAVGNQAVLVRNIPERKDEAWLLFTEAMDIASRNGYRDLIAHFERTRNLFAQTPLAFQANPSPPHPSADGARAAQLNIEYQKALKEWQTLPWLKRLRKPKPTPPIGI